MRVRLQERFELGEYVSIREDEGLHTFEVPPSNTFDRAAVVPGINSRKALP